MNDERHGLVAYIGGIVLIVLAAIGSCTYQASKCIESGGEWKDQACTRKP